MPPFIWDTTSEVYNVWLLMRLHWIEIGKIFPDFEYRSADNGLSSSPLNLVIAKYFNS